MQEMPTLEKTRLEPPHYREAMSRLAGHVHIVTAGEGAARRGVTITAACSVSDDPPSLLVCLNAGNPRNAIFAQSGSFALNMLGASQQDLADIFSGRAKVEAEDRFSHGMWQTGETGAPVLAGAVASFECRLSEMKTIATHTILFGTVEAVHLGPRQPALLYHERLYRTL